MSALHEPPATDLLQPPRPAGPRRGPRAVATVEPHPRGPADAASDLADVVAHASGRMLPEHTIALLLELVTSTAAEVVPVACGAGVTIAAVDATGPGGTRHATAGGTDRLVEHLDARQYELSEGPCLTAWSRRAVVRVDDLEGEVRWPLWSTEACLLGVRSVLSAPLVAGDRALGALKLYSHVPAAFDHGDERAAAMFAAQAALLVSAAAAVRRAGHLDAELQRALRRREVVNQATGIVMGRDHVSAAVALARLAAVGRRDRRSVHDVAHQLVTTTTRER
jgi:GAF domain-containing protein